MPVRGSWWLVPPLLLSLSLSGCALPPAVTVASLAADGASYAATGKSVTDHGLSAATGHDCALLRPVTKGQAVCDTSSVHGKDVPVEVGRASVPRPAPMAVAPQPETAAEKARYVVVASFLNPDNAARAAARYADLHAVIVPVDINGRQFHRVVVGPLSIEEAAALKARLAAG